MVLIYLWPDPTANPTPQIPTSTVAMGRKLRIVKDPPPPPAPKPPTKGKGRGGQTLAAGEGGGVRAPAATTTPAQHAHP